ncbi:MAG TPA: sigma 54-interacting transcriptional regulator [Thermoanaerobaculia bacterium]|nr:sigma 54-interacting transcriptional regulator [Thermoanaerobaculia bacterium]
MARELQRSADETSGAVILGTGAVIAALLSEISIVAASDLPVFVTGETGVGKELVARQVHSCSRRREEALIHVNCDFADSTRRRLGLGPLRLGEEVREKLAVADWPGNVRELENVVSRAVLRAAAGKPVGAPIVVGLEHVDVAPGAVREAPPTAAAPAPAGGPLRERLEDFERRLIREAVARHGGNQAAAARELGMHRANLHHLARRLGLKG